MTGTATARAGAPTEPAGDPGWLRPVLVYGAVLAVLLVVSWLTIAHVAGVRPGTMGPRFAGDWFWGGWQRWDGGWYVGIADSGYAYDQDEQSPVAFFPGYPLAVRAAGVLVDNTSIGGILVTIACGLASAVLFWRWCGPRLDRRASLLAVAALALFPYAWFLYGALYGDALFLAAALGAFLLLEHDRPVLAGLVGAVATATRSVGLALVLGLVVGVLERRGALTDMWRWGLPRRLRLRRLRPIDAGVLLSMAGVLAWMGWLWHRFGDPLAFASVQEAWGQPATPHTWFKVDFFAQLFRGDNRRYAYGLLVQGLLALGALALLPSVARRFGLRYGAYTAGVVLLPVVGSQDFQGVGRYLLAAFPAFAVVGDLLADRPRLALAVLPASAALLVLGTAWFAHGFYLA